MCSRYDRKRIWRISGLFLILLFYLLWTRTSFDLKVRDFSNRIISVFNRFKNPRIFGTEKEPVPINKGSKKLVLGWTPFFSDDFPILWRYGEDVCPNAQNCIFTNDRSYYLEADAIIFHSKEAKRSELPPLRYANQIYVFFLMESPFYTYDSLSSWTNVFNWTMTYRTDSDVYNPYGTFALKDTKRSVTNAKIEKIVRGKSKLVAWFVSECRTYSRREEYGRALQKYIPVDIYGDCGQFECAKSKRSQCDHMLTNDYKFYLAFENSVCKDYVTEKFFRLTKFVVPVVLRGSDYKFAPHRSFIAADQFKSVEALSLYLKYLDSNTTAYMEYFEWHKNWSVEFHPGFSSTKLGLCGLCQKLLDNKTTENSYSSMGDWWYEKGGCEINFARNLVGQSGWLFG